MKKIDIGQTVQILGNLGVITGILLLVYELNQNRQMTAAQTRSSIADSQMALFLARANDGELAESELRVEAGEDISPVERARWRALWAATFRHWENISYQYRAGLYADSEYEASRETWRQLLTTSSVLRDFWCGRVERQSDLFVSEMDDLLGNQRCE